MDACTLICEAHGELVSGTYAEDEDPDVVGICAGVAVLHTSRHPSCSLSVYRESSDDAAVWGAVVEVARDDADARHLAALIERREREAERARRILAQQEAGEQVQPVAPAAARRGAGSGRARPNRRLRLG